MIASLMQYVNNIFLSSTAPYYRHYSLGYAKLLQNKIIQDELPLSAGSPGLAELALQDRNGFESTNQNTLAPPHKNQQCSLNLNST